MSHYKQLFFTANGGLFERPTAAFFYHAGCCRHAAHGVGDGGDDKEENSFSDWRRHRHQKGEADNSRDGFLCLYHPNYVLLRVTPSILFGYTRIRVYKKICVFSGLRPLRLCVLYNISRASSRLFRATPHPHLPDGRLKSHKCKKSAVGGKKSPAAPVQKNNYLIIYR